MALSFHDIARYYRSLDNTTENALNYGGSRRPGRRDSCGGSSSDSSDGDGGEDGDARSSSDASSGGSDDMNKTQVLMHGVQSQD